jgi:thermitase
MKLKIVTGILLILLLSNFITATVNIPNATALVNNSQTTQNTTDDLLKNVNLNEKTGNTQKPTTTDYQNLWDFAKQNQAQTNTSLSDWNTYSPEIVIGLANMPDAYTKIEQLALAKNGKIVNKILINNKVEAVVVNIPQDAANSFTAQVKENNLSKYIEPNQKYQAFMTPNDPDWTLQWGPQRIEADYAWNTTTGSNTVLVCVIDTGVDYNHPDLAANYVSGGYDWVNMDADPIDDHGHGTHCAGIIGAVINNDMGIAGLAQVRIMAEKGLDSSGSGWEDDLANAIIHATDMGASILSMSWGGSTSSALIHDALKYAYDQGVLLVAAAGNSGTSDKLYPAAYDEVIAVTATDPTDAPAWFTSYGNWVELAAPGVDIYSTISAVHSPSFNYPYDYLSGTSMACPHVSGVAALVWSKNPSMARDVLRLHLRDTADDRGAPGFDIYYGYGRINARKAIETPLPQHEIFVSSWKRPPYVAPNSTALINATIVNYGRSNETGVTVQLLANSSIVQSDIVDLVSGTSTVASLLWAPTTSGMYNVTVYVLPVFNETNLNNNMIQGYIYVGTPLKVFVLRSAGTQVTTDAWNVLNYNWNQYGDQLIYIDYTTLNKDNITYSDLNATGADVLILSCAYAWEYTDAEIEAIKQYVFEGHGFIATAGTFYYQVPNNNKFASMFGISENVTWVTTGTDLMNLLDPSHPVFVSVPNPYTMPAVTTAIPYETSYSPNLLTDGKYIAAGFYNESAIVVRQGLIYISPWLEAIPERYHFNLQILYNAMLWSQYRKPDHELRVSLQAPSGMFPNSSVLLNGTVTNNGIQNETNITFQISIAHDATPIWSESDFILLLEVGASYQISHLLNTSIYGTGTYNVTAYAPAVAGEEFTADNKVTVLIQVLPPLIQPTEGQWARYNVTLTDNSTGQSSYAGKLQLNYSKYISTYQMNVTLLSIMPGQSNQTDWTVVNIFNRFCESGVWQNYWFPGMIETNININSEVNVLYGPATVIGSETLIIGSRFVECWKLVQPLGYATYVYWYAKTNGLWIRLEFSSGSIHETIMLEETNIPAGYTPEHELLVTLNAPSSIQLGNSSMLNATVFNYGLNDETNMTLMLKINGTIVQSLVIDSLLVNSSTSIQYLWTPPIEAAYNVTAHVSPVAGENMTNDNTASATVIVAALKGHVLIDQTHMTDSISSYYIWVSALTRMGYIVDLHTNGSITADVLRNYDAFVIIQSYLPYSSDELVVIEEFVTNGGGLLVVGDDYPDLYTNLTSFASIYWTYGGTSGYTSHITIHEVTQGVSSVFISNPMAMLNIGGSAQGLVRDSNYQIMLAVTWYGRGRVMGFAPEDSVRDYVITSADNLLLATNMVVWLCKKDTTVPQIFSVNPSNGTIIGTTNVMMQWAAIDRQSGISKYYAYRNGELAANTTLQSTLVSGLIEGPNNITIVAYDRAGNYISSYVTITVDLTPPAVEIISPANNSYVRQILTINVSCYDNLPNCIADLYIDAQHVATFNGTYAYLWNTTAEFYNIHSITLIGYDAVGNNANITIAVTVDNDPPVASITSPANGTYLRGSATITFFVPDQDLESAFLTILNASYAKQFNVMGNASETLDTTQLLDGNYTVKLVALDWAGNNATSLINVTIDNTLPDAQIINPETASYVKGTINVNFTFADSNLEKAVLKLDGSLLVESTSITYYTLNTSSLNDGIHTLTLTVSDIAANSKTVEVTVTVDNTLPDVAILEPSDGDYKKGTVDITFYAYDANIESISLHIEGGSLTSTWNSSGTHSHPWDTTTYPDGTHAITILVTDKAGNQRSVTSTITVDNTQPTFLTTSLENGTTLSGTVTINYTATDSNPPVTLILYIDDLPILLNQPYPWDTTTVGDGDHTIRIVATDLVGNTKQTTITVKTANAPSWYTPYVYYAIAGVLGLALGAAAVWLLLKRKPTPKP